MTANSAIEWTDHTFNPWIGCTKVSPACDHCYAERSIPARFQAVAWGPHEPRRRTSAANWALPKRWNAQHLAFFNQHGRRQRVFCASLADVFDNAVPWQWRLDLFDLISRTPNLDWLLLTKRVGNVRPMLDEIQVHGTLAEVFPNVWLGVTITSQAEADRDIPKLLALPAARRFLSMEPLLGLVDLQKSCTYCCPNKGACFAHGSGHRMVVDSENGGTLAECICSRLNGIHWVIVGGESGPGARPMHPDWARSLRDQCQAAGVPYFFKQWGEWEPKPSVGIWTGPSTRDYPWEGVSMLRDGRVCMRERTQAECLERRRQGHMYCPSVVVDAAAVAAFHAGDTSYQWMFRAGKKAAGRLLDGRTWDEAPR